MWTPHPIAKLTLTGALGSVLLSGVLFASGQRTVAGRVVDNDGEAVGGAMILLTLIDTPTRPQNFSGFDDLSNSQNRFHSIDSRSDGTFATLLPDGRYRIAAYKSGYDVTVAPVNTRARAFLNLRLRQVTRSILGDLPGREVGRDLDLDWILRQPTRDVFRDTEETVADATGFENGTPAGSGSGAGEGRTDGSLNSPLGEPALAFSTPGPGLMDAILGPLGGQFSQEFSGGRPGEDQAALGDTNGRTTTLTLTGGMGERGTWTFAGRAGKYASDLDGGALRRDSSTDRMRARVDLRLSPDDVLTAEIEYGTNHFAVDSKGDATGATRQDQRTIGMRSRWNRSIGESGSLYVDGAFYESGVRMPGGGELVIPVLQGDSAINGRTTDRSWLAAAGLSFNSGDHTVNFGMRAKTYSYDLRDRGVVLYNLSDAPALAELGSSGNAVSLFAEDDWRVADGYEVNYGVGYHSNVSSGSAYLVPRVGFTRRLTADGATLVRSMVMLRLDDPGLSSLYASPEEAPAGRRDVGRIGYMVGIERRPPGSLQISATFRYQPFDDAMASRHRFSSGGVPGDEILVLTDGAADRQEFDVELAHAYGNFRGSFAGSVGRVRGKLTPAVEEAPIQILQDGEVRYYLTRLRAIYSPTETEFVVGYRWMLSETGVDPLAPPGERDFRRLDLMIHQDLPWLRDNWRGSWRVLMAYQDLDYGSLYDGSGHSTPVSASRLTGGVDIRF